MVLETSGTKGATTPEDRAAHDAPPKAPHVTLQWLYEAVFPEVTANNKLPFLFNFNEYAMLLQPRNF